MEEEGKMENLLLIFNLGTLLWTIGKSFLEIEEEKKGTGEAIENGKENMNSMNSMNSMKDVFESRCNQIVNVLMKEVTILKRVCWFIVDFIRPYHYPYPQKYREKSGQNNSDFQKSILKQSEEYLKIWWKGFHLQNWFKAKKEWWDRGGCDNSLSSSENKPSPTTTICLELCKLEQLYKVFERC